MGYADAEYVAAPPGVRALLSTLFCDGVVPVLEYVPSKTGVHPAEGAYRVASELRRTGDAYNVTADAHVQTCGPGLATAVLTSTGLLTGNAPATTSAERGVVNGAADMHGAPRPVCFEPAANVHMNVDDLTDAFGGACGLADASFDAQLDGVTASLAAGFIGFD